MQRLLIDALTRRETAFFKALKACRRSFSTKTVHRLRIAARRMLALTDVIRSIVPEAHTRKLRTYLKDLLHGLNALRDTQVMLADLSENADGSVALAPFREWLRNQKRRQSKEARALVDGTNADKLSRLLVKLHAETAEVRAGGENMLCAVDEVYGAVCQRYRSMRSTRPASIHRTRVAFKAFRYTAELVQPILPETFKPRLKQIRAYQALMGSIQDARTRLNALREFGAPAAALRCAEKHQTELITAFFGKKRALTTFWRSAPNRPFPWDAGRS